MQKALNLIRHSLSDIYPQGEIEGFIRLIFDALCGYSTTDLLLNRHTELPVPVTQQVVSIVNRLRQHEPIQYILGKAYFGDMSMIVGRGVLIPRPETHEIVERIVAMQGDVRGRVADICTGSGCIAIALAHKWPNATVEGWDISTEALDYARRNADANNVQVAWIERDVLAYTPAHEPRYEIMVSNPPYVLDSERKGMDSNVLQYEPHQALFVPDEEPLLFYNAIADIAQRELLPAGVLYFEINCRMGEACSSMLRTKGFVDIEVYKDFMGADRMVRCVKA
ncbi:MAG: peptide chain release factor N(5)-glutamine methyltransferase [Bacteroidales bacterium]|nr:peptide chain release factor N(5)-glutamine methyltransferase [Bacteroidales bacterium]